MNLQNYNSKIIILLGPQGSGKGTQAALLAKDLGKEFALPVVDMGQLLRKKIKGNSQKSLEIKKLLKRVN